MRCVCVYVFFSVSSRIMACHRIGDIRPDSVARPSPSPAGRELFMFVWKSASAPSSNVGVRTHHHRCKKSRSKVGKEREKNTKLSS